MATVDAHGEALIINIGKALLAAEASVVTAKATYNALASYVLGERDDPEPEPEPVATENPETCQHPNTMDLVTGAGTTVMCSTCGTTVSEP